MVTPRIYSISSPYPGAADTEMVTLADYAVALKAKDQELAHINGELSRTRQTAIAEIAKWETAMLESDRLIRAKDEEIAQFSKKVNTLTAWYDKMFGTPCEEIRHAQQLEEQEEKYNTLLDQTIRFAEMCRKSEDRSAEDFLNQPYVQKRMQARRKEQG